MIGTSSIERGLTRGIEAPGGMMSKCEASFWLRRTSAGSSCSPTRNRTITIDIPGLDVE